MDKILSPQGYSISTALQAVEHFCKKYGVELKTPHIVEITLAWRERGTYEWTPCGRDFRRILFCDPEENFGRYVTVFDYRDVNMELTKELDDMIKRFLRDRWYEER